MIACFSLYLFSIIAFVVNVLLLVTVVLPIFAVGAKTQTANLSSGSPFGIFSILSYRVQDEKLVPLLLSIISLF